MGQTTYSNVRGDHFSAEQTLVVEQCPNCGILYAIPEALDRYLSKYNKAAYPNNYAYACCPAGHQWHRVGLNAEQQAKKDRDIARDREVRERARRDQAEASLKAQRSATTRIKNQRDRERKRAASGVCPCCNRTFKQLARHMANQHPDFPPKVGIE